MDKYRELRMSLEARPTQGPWKANTSNEIGPISREDDQSFGMILPVAFAEFENSEANRRYIAACHPEAIRDLLAERDALRTALSYYLSCFEQHNITNTHGARDFDFTGQIAGMARAALTQG